MTVESASYPSQLVATNPPFNDPKNEGDDHLRLIKSVLTITFANVAGPLGLAVTIAGAHTWSGTHNFSAVTSMVLPSASVGGNLTVAGTLDATGLMSAAAPALTSNSNQVATTSFVQALFTATPASLAWRSRMMFYGGNR